MLVFPICPFIGKWSSKISPHSHKEYSLTDLAKIVINFTIPYSWQKIWTYNPFPESIYPKICRPIDNYVGIFNEYSHNLNNEDCGD